MKNTRGRINHRCSGKCKKEHAPHKFTLMTKRCANCEDFVFVDNFHVRDCPCCGYQLRHYPQNANLKRKFMILMKIKYL